MATCNSCGGVIGRDCFNPSECAWISEQQEQQRYQSMQNTLEESLSGMSFAATDSYRKHCGENALAMAQDDLLGQTLHVLHNLVGAHGEYGWPSAQLEEARTILAKLKTDETKG